MLTGDRRLKFIFLLSLFCFLQLSLLVAQETPDQNPVPASNPTPEIQATNAPVKVSPEESQLQNHLNGLQTDNEKFMQMMEAHKNDPTFLMKYFVSSPEVRGAAGMPKDIDAFVRAIIAPFKQMTEVELKSTLLLNTEKTVFHSLFASSPRSLLFVTRILRDNDALPSLACILKDQTKILIFIGVNIAIMFVGWGVKRYQYSIKRSFLESVQLWFFRFLLIMGMRIGVLIFFYHEELSPLWRIFLSVL